MTTTSPRTLIACTLLLFSAGARAQQGTIYPAHPSLDAATASTGGGLPSNSVSHITVNRRDLWIGTGKGLAMSADGARSWTSYVGVPQFISPGIYSIAARGDTIWAATGYTKDVNGQSVQTGSGFTYSRDNGLTWTATPQPLDPPDDSTIVYGINTIRILPITVPEQNVTFDAALTPHTVWIASWSSGIRRSTDLGATWVRTVLPSKFLNSISPADSLGYYAMDPRRDNNFLGFSVAAESDSVIWAGTAGGVNRSTDGGVSWRKFTRDNQTEHILGDWVIAIGIQPLSGRNRVWTTNWPAEGAGQEYGVSSSDDGGMTWANHLRGIKVYDLAFRDSAVYAASDEGLFRSNDAGRTWVKSGTIVDLVSGHRLLSPSFYAAGAVNDSVYGGSSEGLVKTIDNPGKTFGTEWVVYRTAQPLTGSDAVYAYPNPFSPRFEVTRIRYTTGTEDAPVTIEIFDFGMNRVRTLIRDAQRRGERDEIWDGRDETGALARNGVYFYRVEVGDSEPVWGKVMVIQ
jgi:hypothetical protein